MPDYPRSLIDFQQRFPDDAACARYLGALRWPDGLRCLACGHDRAWSLRSKPWVYECRGGLRDEHLQVHLDEFVFRFNRRHPPCRVLISPIRRHITKARGLQHIDPNGDSGISL